MQDISQIWQNECIKTINFIMSLTCVMLNNYREQEFLRFISIIINIPINFIII